MRRIKQITLLCLCGFMITMLPFSAIALEKADNEKAQYRAKDEVIYATLLENGKVEDVYAVNVFDVTKSGNITDYGTYSKVTNLTDLAVIDHDKEKITIPAEIGRFYYQGNIENTGLPWEFSVTYFLNGKEVSPQELLGKNGEVEIRVNVSANKAVDALFFENYTLQISLPFDTEQFSNIRAEDGLIANAGKEQQVTFTLMPEKEMEFSVTATVADFSFNGIEIIGVPLTMKIDRPDTDEMTGEMSSLSDAVTKIHEGVRELHQGAVELNEGAHTLQKGSVAFRDGLTEFAQSSEPLLAGSEKINTALEQISRVTIEDVEFDAGDITQLTNGLAEIATGLRDTANGLEEFEKGYGAAFTALDGAIAEIPALALTKEQINALYASGVDQQTIDKLVATYAAAQKVKGTYAETRAVLSTASNVMGQTSTGLREMANHLDEMTHGLGVAQDGIASLEQIPTLISGLKQMAREYASFHEGLKAYTNGAKQIGHSYNELYQGIRGLAAGTDELTNGAANLEHGTGKLQKATADLPKQLTKEIDEMIAQYDREDFEAASFVSPKNEKVDVVQFVIKTAEIKDNTSEKEKEPSKEKKGFWTLFKELFTKK